MYFIYKIRNSINGKLYIGQSKNPKNRWKQHRKSKKSYLSKAILKYGEEHFTMEILEEIQTKQEANQKEQEWISVLETQNRNKGYNQTSGGEGSDHTNYKTISERQREMIEDGSHYFCTDRHRKTARKLRLKEIEEGKNPFQNSEIQSKIQKKRVAKGTHHLLSGKVQKRYQDSLVTNGTHIFQSGQLQKEKAARQLQRPLVIEVKALYKELKIKQPPLVHARSDEWLEGKKQELLSFKII